MSIQLKDKIEVAHGPHLEQLSGGDKGRVFHLHNKRLTLGRADENDIVIPVEGVSRVHALLVNSEGSWFIRDNNSKNGIYVNGNLVKESWLESGDTVQLGHFIFRFDAGSVSALREAGLPEVAGLGGSLDAMPEQSDPSRFRSQTPRNPRILLYAAVLFLFLGYYFWGSSSQVPSEDTAAQDGASGLARDFKTIDKPKLEIGTSGGAPSGLEDPMLKRAEQEMAKLDWSNTSLREAEQFFRRGQREFLNRNFHRAIDAFRAALSLYSGHLLSERYLRFAIYEAEMEAKKHMTAAIQYYESLQYSRAIHHFNEVLALMAHRPNEPFVKECKGYIKQAELRLQAAELFP